MSDYLSDEEQVTALKTWWNENGTSTIVGLVLVIVAALGWRWYVDYRQVQSEAASATYQQYLEARSENRDSAGELETLEASFPGSSYELFTLFYRASDATKAEKYSDAAPLLLRAIDVADDSRLKDLARVRLAKVLAQQSDYDGAVKHLSDVRSEGFRALAAETKGDILIARGDTAGAADAYRAAVDANTAGGTAAPELSRQDAVLEAKLADATRADAPK